MKIKQSHHSKIINLLEERNDWVCGLEIQKLFIRDDRKRISELNHSGYKILGEPCNLHIHDSRIFMRKLIKKPKLNSK